MVINGNIRIYKAFPNDTDPEGYLPINGSVVRNGDTIYLEVNASPGYGVAQIKRNGTPITPLPTVVEGRYMITIDDCTDNYTVVLGRIPGVSVSVMQDEDFTNLVIFEN